MQSGQYPFCQTESRQIIIPPTVTSQLSNVRFVPKDSLKFETCCTLEDMARSDYQSASIWSKNVLMSASGLLNKLQKGSRRHLPSHE